MNVSKKEHKQFNKCVKHASFIDVHDGRLRKIRYRDHEIDRYMSCNLPFINVHDDKSFLLPLLDS